MPKEPKRKQHNLGGVRLNEHTWKAVRQRFKAERELDESFSAWVRRKLVAA